MTVSTRQVDETGRLGTSLVTSSSGSALTDESSVGRFSFISFLVLSNVAHLDNWAKYNEIKEWQTCSGTSSVAGFDRQDFLLDS
jgi:hypothetical protein